MTYHPCHPYHDTSFLIRYIKLRMLHGILYPRPKIESFCVEVPESEWDEGEEWDGEGEESEEEEEEMMEEDERHHNRLITKPKKLTKDTL